MRVMNQTLNRTEMKDNIWTVDNRASYHMTNSLEGMKDLKDDFSRIKIGSRKTMLSKKEVHMKQ